MRSSRFPVYPRFVSFQREISCCVNFEYQSPIPKHLIAFGRFQEAIQLDFDMLHVEFCLLLSDT